MSSLLRPKKKLECDSVRQFNEYVNHYDADLLPTRIRRFQKLGSVMSLEKLEQTLFAVITTKTPVLMGFLVYELKCQCKYTAKDHKDISCQNKKCTVQAFTR
jgi:hypothetical protein